MIEFIRIIVFLIWLALTIAFLFGMVNPRIVMPSHEKVTRVDILIFCLLIPTVLIVAGTFVIVIVQNPSFVKDDRLVGAVALIVLLLASIIVIGLIKPSYVIHWGNLRNRTRVLLYYGTPILLVVAMMFALRPFAISYDRAVARNEIDTVILSGVKDLAAQEGMDCGAYYAENWGESISSLVHDNFQHVDDYKRCDVYLERVETSWGNLYRALFFIDRRLVVMEMLAVSNSISQGDEASWLELWTTITRSCFDQHDDPIVLGGTVSWLWAPSTGGFTTSFAMKGPDDKSIILLVINNDNQAGFSLYTEYLKAGHITYLESYL